MNYHTLKSVPALSLAAVALSFGPLAFAQSSNPTSTNPTSEPSSSAPSSDPSAASPSSSAMPAPSLSSNASSTWASSPSSAERAGDAGSDAARSADAALADASQEANHATGSLRKASAGERDHAADKLAGSKVADSNGKELGKVKDFLIDPQSGQVRFAVISSGGVFGVGDKLRLVPFTSLQQEGTAERFTASVTKSQFEQQPTVNEESLEEGTISAGQYGSSSQAVARSSSSSTAGAGSLVRASALKGREVRSGETTLGKIEAVALDSGAKASVLLKPNRDIAGSDQEIVVPIGRLSISGENAKNVTTTLTRSDFQSAAQSVSNYASQETASDVSVRQSQNVAGEATSGTAMSAPIAPGDQPGTEPSASMAANESASSPTSTAPTRGMSSTDANATTASRSPAVTMAQSSTAPSYDNPNRAGEAQASSGRSTSDRQSQVATNEMQSGTETAGSSNTGTSASSHVTSTNEEGLSPTGQTSADQNPSADSKLLAAAQAVRHALDADPAASRADVRVLPENGKIVLRGNVDSSSAKSSIEKLAEQSAQGCDIDSQLKTDRNQ